MVAAAHHDTPVASYSSFLTWIKVVFWDGRRLAHLLGQVVRLLRYGARRAGERAPCCLETIQHQLRTPWPTGSRQAAEVKMVGYITIAHHGTAQWLSEEWRHFACTSVVIFFYISILCWHGDPTMPDKRHVVVRSAAVQADHELLHPRGCSGVSDRANLAKILSCRIDPPTSLVYGG